jgi:hypothetical protein
MIRLVNNEFERMSRKTRQSMSRPGSEPGTSTIQVRNIATEKKHSSAPLICRYVTIIIKLIQLTRKINSSSARTYVNVLHIWIVLVLNNVCYICILNYLPWHSFTSNCANPFLKGGWLALALPLIRRELVRALLFSTQPGEVHKVAWLRHSCKTYFAV